MLFRNKSAQSAVEYILIVAFALFMIIPATSLFTNTLLILKQLLLVLRFLSLVMN